MRLPRFAPTILLALVFLVGLAVGQIGVGAASVLGLAATATPAPTSTPAPTATPLHTATPEPTSTPVETETPVPTSTPTPTPTTTTTPTSTPTHTPVKGASYFEDGSTMVTVYGRGFKIAPILGFLGNYRGFADMEADVKKRFYPVLQEQNGGKPVIPAVHLIYAGAVPCSPGEECLLYQEAFDDVLKDYIEPAGRNGWHVILDSQMGRSDPVAQVKRMIDKGYLKYDHVHVALDPEFKAYPGRNLPGIPVGQLDARDINKAMELVDQHARQVGLKRKKIFMIHQFGDPEVDDGVPYMILNKKELKPPPTIDLILDADGFGGPDAKASKYNRMLNDAPYPFIQYRAIKLFLPNPEAPNHYDKPQMEWPAVFGKKDTPGGHRIRWAPNVIVIA
jgi:hypothetical protein